MIGANVLRHRRIVTRGIRGYQEAILHSEQRRTDSLSTVFRPSLLQLGATLIIRSQLHLPLQSHRIYMRTAAAQTTLAMTSRGNAQLHQAQSTQAMNRNDLSPHQRTTLKFSIKYYHRRETSRFPNLGHGQASCPIDNRQTDLQSGQN
jgi:hypothetical protein